VNVLTPGPLTAPWRAAVLAACLALVAVLGVADWATGTEIGFSIFYLVPVAAAGWLAGRWAGVVLSVISAATWAVADYTAGAVYSYPLIPVWNATMRGGIFLITALLLANLRMILGREQANSRLDALTGAGNWRSFSDIAERELGRIRREPTPITVGYLDLDDFKQVNDTLGHAAGDDLLVLVAETLRHRIRAMDFVARLGGDEFAVILPGTDAGGAARLFARIQAILLDAARRRGWPVGFSVGIVTWRVPPASVQDMVKAADDLMYQAKRDHKGAILTRTIDEGAAAPVG
jgi:diguanylate cyclase (GGDEF)-like protein